MNYTKTLDQLRAHEGEELYPYRCTEGYLTIGVGRNLETNGLSEKEQLSIIGECLPNVEVIQWITRNGITKEQSAELFLNDVSRIEEQLHELNLLDGHNDPRQAVLINMAYQMGISGLLKFRRTLKHYRNHSYDKAADEILDSRYAMQTPRRAKEMSEQMRRGEW